MVEFLDVGQGDAALVTFPDGRTMLVDSGGRPSMKRTEEETFEPDVPRVGEAVVSEFLWEKGLARIDLLVPTHADADHMQGMADVLRNFQVGGLLVARSATADEDFAEMQSAAVRSSVPVQEIARGDNFEMAGVTVEVLHPEASEEDSWPNDRSVVIRLVHGSTRILLTGDIEAGAEGEILETGEIAADVVKAAHHGSRTSSTQRFVDASGARTVIVPVGRRSMFGHPHPDVVERWKASGADVLKTGDCGTISAISDGVTVQVATYVECRPL
jgi:competence protein ComEC